LLRENWDATTKSITNEKELNGKIGKMGEMKKAMPFVMQLKKRLQSGEEASVVLERKLAFDEQKTLLDMVSGLKRSTGFQRIAVIKIQEGTKKGNDLTDGGKEVDVTSPIGDNAVPGQPSFLLENFEA
jgi:leucyl-tRNA synthetase